MKRLFIAILFVVSFLFPSVTFAERISFLVIDANSYLVNKAVKGLELPENINVKFFTYNDITGDKSAADFIDASEVIIVML